MLTLRLGGYPAQKIPKNFTVSTDQFGPEIKKKCLHAENVCSSKNIDTVVIVEHCCLDMLKGEIDSRIGDTETRKIFKHAL
jgi:hypothetical protein